MPPSEASHHLAVAGEDVGHFDAARALIERVLCEQVEWIEREMLPRLIAFRERSSGQLWFKLSSATSLARERRLLVQPPFGSGGEARQVRAQLMLWQHEFQGRGDLLSAAIILRDSDGVSSRRANIEAGVGDFSAFPVVLGVPHPEVEAWSICGFFPRNERESERLAALRGELHFDPTTRSEALLSTAPSSPKDAKEVLARLTSDDADRAADCLTSPPLGQLRSRGTENGLCQFLDEVEGKLLPLFSGVPRRSVTATR